jgi:hypothetical protein
MKHRTLAVAARPTLVLLAAGLGCNFKSINPEPAAPQTQAPLPREYTPDTGLVRLHFDDDFKVNAERSVTFLKSSAPEHKSFIAVIANDKPVTEDPAEYARILQSTREKTLAGYKLISMRPTTCYRDIQGVETRWQFGDEGKTLTSRACAFIHNHHGYSLMYAVDPESPVQEAKLRRVVDATELTDNTAPAPAAPASTSAAEKPRPPST